MIHVQLRFIECASPEAGIPSRDVEHGTWW